MSETEHSDGNSSTKKNRLCGEQEGNEIEIKGQMVLITGASSGFGAAAARLFADTKRSFCSRRDGGPAGEVRGRSPEAGAREAPGHKLDVSQTSSVKAFANGADKNVAGGRLDQQRGWRSPGDTVAEGKMRIGDDAGNQRAGGVCA